jgi:hypothetical protein
LGGGAVGWSNRGQLLIRARIAGFITEEARKAKIEQKKQKQMSDDAKMSIALP